MLGPDLIASDSDVVSNAAPTQLLDVYVCGTNCYGELGLGDATKKSELPGPVLNPKLSASDVGVVYIAVGGVHSAALTRDNKILTWGVNDEGALGRNTVVPPKTNDSDQGQAQEKEDSDGDDEDADEVDLNLIEATPTAIDASHFAEGTMFVQLIATDSATFALTCDGLVYGWGTFRVRLRISLVKGSFSHLPAANRLTLGKQWPHRLLSRYRYSSNANSHRWLAQRDQACGGRSACPRPDFGRICLQLGLW